MRIMLKKQPEARRAAKPERKKAEGKTKKPM
jgi:hypothetical protein